jgi:type II secretory pathway pseudopilin PulG
LRAGANSAPFSRRETGQEDCIPIQARKSAFTLMELILVMLILTFVVAMIAPSLRGFAVGRNTNNMANALLMEAQYARSQAVNEGRTYRLNFDPQGRSFWLTVVNGATADTLASDLGKEVELPQGIQMRTDVQPQLGGGKGAVFVEFHSNGRCDPAHIWLSDLQGKEIEIACQSPTEMFRILPPEEMTR